MAKLLLACLTLLTMSLAGCIDDAPPYDAKILTYDQGLLGKWDLTSANKPDAAEEPKVLPVEITARNASITEGRLGKYNSHDSSSAKETTFPAYRITLTAPASDNDKDAKDQVFTYDAVLIKVGDSTFVAYQPSPDRDVQGLYMDYLPVHRLALLEHKGDTLTIKFMKSQVVWLPTLEPIDTPSTDAKLPEGKGHYLITKPDRLVKVLALALKTPDAWDEPLSLTRTPK